jgi:hypothetical protein
MDYPCANSAGDRRLHAKRAVTMIWVASATFFCAMASSAQELREARLEQEIDAQAARDAQLSAAGRLIHYFDFDERDEGNLESTPKYWSPFESSDFPRYATGEFDDAIGFESPPSFHLTSQGRNAAYRYAGPETEVDTQSEYLIVGWVQADRLENARAALSAYYVDHDRLPIAETQVFSDLIGSEKPGDTPRIKFDSNSDGANETDPASAATPAPWRRVELYLPVGPEEAATIGLTAWVVQPEVWDRNPKERRHIKAFDIDGGAWFDDIRLFRLPRVNMETNGPGNVVGAESDAALSVSVIESSDAEVRARLTIETVSGETLLDRPLPLHANDLEPAIELPLSDFDDGLYRARVWVSARGVLLAQRVLTFAKIHWANGQEVRGARAFGVTLTVDEPTPPLINLALLRKLNVGAVKIPVWSGAARIPDLVDAGEGMDAMLYGLLKARVLITGVLAGPPSTYMNRAGAYSQPLLTLLSDRPEAWRDDLARVLAPYSGVFDTWQIGSDDGADSVVDSQRWEIVDRVRSAMTDLNTAPRLTVPGSVSWAPGDRQPGADIVSLKIDDYILPEYIQDHLAAYRDAGWPLSAAFLTTTPVPIGAGVQDAELAVWLKRLVLTRLAGVETVYVPQVWRTRYGPNGAVTEPTAEFLIFHTAVRTLGEAGPIGSIYIAPGVTAPAFERGEEVILVAWDDSNGDGANRYALQLGKARESIDMWGRRNPIERADDGRQIIELSRSPIFIRGVERWMVMFRTLMSIEPDVVPYSIGAHSHTLKIVNPHVTPLSGEIRLRLPDGWDVEPSRFRFSAPVGGVFEQLLEIRFPRNETAGEKRIIVDADVQADGRYHFEAPIAIRLGSDELDVWGFAYTEGDKLVVRHGVTNRSDVTLNMRGSAVAPGRIRQNRILLEFLPGQSMIFEYHFPNAEDLRDREIRLNLREVNGPRIHNLSTVAR